MGFRSTFTTSDYPIEWPSWFREKYAGSVHVPEKGGLSSKAEHKVYFSWQDLEADIQKAIVWDEWGGGAPFRFALVYLHECGGITRVEIGKDSVAYTKPIEWEETDDELGHNYCYGCSDVERVGVR